MPERWVKYTSLEGEPLYINMAHVAMLHTDRHMDKSHRATVLLFSHGGTQSADAYVMAQEEPSHFLVPGTPPHLAALAQEQKEG